ncbi:hypothetical protein ACSYDW_08400 [Paeniglutamicibacter sp. R2-26]|uniref:hypothetical protein n=1 Tax=Paeniglutamicibacter sp. R2-26 TaxID=3144417 RepID=UPI003EE47157
MTVIGLVYSDGKSLNVLAEKSATTKRPTFEIVGNSSDALDARLQVVAESSRWIQFYGRIPGEMDEFELKAMRGGRRVPVADGTAGVQGQGHVQSSTSWKTGARWLAAFRRNSIQFGLVPDSEPISILGISTGLGRIKLRLGCSTESSGSPTEVVLRARKSDRQIVIPVESDSREGECLIDASSVAEALVDFPVGESTWDVSVNGARLHFGRTDIAHPRAAFRFGWVVARSGKRFVKMRPYWTLDKKLAIEMKMTAEMTTPSSP